MTASGENRASQVSRSLRPAAAWEARASSLIVGVCSAMPKVEQVLVFRVKPASRRWRAAGITPAQIMTERPCSIGTATGIWAGWPMPQLRGLRGGEEGGDAAGDGVGTGGQFGAGA